MTQERWATWLYDIFIVSDQCLTSTWC
jgi:hypothetical protein